MHTGSSQLAFIALGILQIALLTVVDQNKQYAYNTTDLTTIIRQQSSEVIEGGDSRVTCTDSSQLGEQIRSATSKG